MKIQARNLALLIVLVFLALFAGLNWASFAEPTDLRLLVTTVAVPLGVVMLVVVAALTAFYGFSMARYQVQLAVERSRAAKELEKVRALADKAEESRFEKLGAYLREELGEIRRLQQEQLEQSEAAAVDLAATVLEETTGIERRLGHVEERVGREPG
jgi:hypothetical protein